MRAWWKLALAMGCLHSIISHQKRFFATGLTIWMSAHLTNAVWNTLQKCKLTFESHSFNVLMLRKMFSPDGPGVTASCSQRTIKLMPSPRSYLRYLKKNAYNRVSLSTHTLHLDRVASKSNADIKLLSRNSCLAIFNHQAHGIACHNLKMQPLGSCLWLF